MTPASSHFYLEKHTKLPLSFGSIKLTLIADRQSVQGKCDSRRRRDAHLQPVRLTGASNDATPIKQLSHIGFSLSDRQCLQSHLGVEKGKDLLRPVLAPPKSIIRIHGGISKGFSTLITQMRTSKIGLNHFLHNGKVPEFDSGRCDCRRDLQIVRHVLQECSLHHRLRRDTRRGIERKEPAGSVEVSKMLAEANYVKYAQKAALFVRKTGLLGQFADLSPPLTKL